MAIVEMNKISLIGLNRDKKKIIQCLMKLGVCEITSNQDKLELEEWSGLVAGDGDSDVVSGLEAQVDKVSSVLKSFEEYDTSKKPLFFVKKTMTQEQVDGVLSDYDRLWNVVETVLSNEERLSAINSQKNRNQNLITSLEPWRELDIPLELISTRYTTINIGVIPSSVNTVQFKEEMEQTASEIHLEIIHSDSDQTYILVVYSNTVEEAVNIVYKKYGFVKVNFKDLIGTAQQNIYNALNEVELIEAEYKNIESQIKELVVEKANIEVIHDWLMTKMASEKALYRLVKTEKVFMLEGWIPANMKQMVEVTITQKWDCMIEVSEPREDEDFPVLLCNNAFAESVESITDMYSTPNSRELDPNAVMAPFFVIFFGLMLSDGGYGILMALTCGGILWKVKLEDSMKKFFRLMMYCGFSTMLWGALFGGWFGIATFTKYAIWFNPVEDPEELLKWSLAFGVIHIFVGLAVRGVNLIRKKRYLDVVFDVLLWYVFFSGFVLFVLPYVPKVNPTEVTGLVEVGKYLLIIGGALLILTQGRSKKGFFGKLLGGVSSMYDLISFMSDVLSYSRLLALGLATSVIASIVNDMSMMVGYSGIKFIAFVLILLIGHAFNFSINALGAYVHSSRLQYIEFFGKFYTGGGTAFEALRADTKYITIKG